MTICPLGMYLAAMSFAASAQSPFIGTWKQNFGRSLGPSAEHVSAAVLRIENAGANGVRITHEFVTKDSRVEPSIGVFTLDGSDALLTGKTTPPGYTHAFRPIGKNVWERVQKTNGNVRGRGYWAVSNDGKTMVITNFGKDEKGQDRYFHRVLERQ